MSKLSQQTSSLIRVSGHNATEDKTPKVCNATDFCVRASGVGFGDSSFCIGVLSVGVL